jgi:hypothetical protein
MGVDLMAERLYTTDFIKITFVYRDSESGRFISKEKAEQLKRENPGRVKKETRMILKKKPKGLNIKAKKGRQISKRDFYKIVNYVKRNNMALTLSRKTGMSFKEAMQRVKTAEKLYKKGLISDREFGFYVGS